MCDLWKRIFITTVFIYCNNKINSYLLINSYGHFTLRCWCVTMLFCFYIGNATGTDISATQPVAERENTTSLPANSTVSIECPATLLVTDQDNILALHLTSTQHPQKYGYPTRVTHQRESLFSLIWHDLCKWLCFSVWLHVILVVHLLNACKIEWLWNITTLKGILQSVKGSQY